MASLLLCSVHTLVVVIERFRSRRVKMARADNLKGNANEG